MFSIIVMPSVIAAIHTSFLLHTAYADSLLCLGLQSVKQTRQRKALQEAGPFMKFANNFIYSLYLNDIFRTSLTDTRTDSCRVSPLEVKI